MTIRITHTLDQERTPGEIAGQNGKDPSVYARDMVTTCPDGVRSKGGKTFEEITPVKPNAEEIRR